MRGESSAGQPLGNDLLLRLAAYGPDLAGRGGRERDSCAGSVDLDLVIRALEGHENALVILRPHVDDASVRSGGRLALRLLLQGLIRAGEGVRGDDEVMRALRANGNSLRQIAHIEVAPVIAG